MKIIAKIDSGNFIIQATKDEIANVLGYHSEYSMPDSGNNRPYGSSSEKLSVGQDIAVNEMFQACQSVKDSSKQIEEAIKTHRRLIGNMEKFSAAILPAAAILESKEPKK